MKDKKENKDKDFEKEIKTLKQNLDDLDTLYKIEKANFLNYKKEEANRVNMYQEMAKLEVLEHLFHVLNSFHSSKPMLKNANQEVQKGFDLIELQLENILKKYDINKITQNEVFDPNLHEVIDTIEGKEEGKITEVLSSGYMYKDKVLIPTKVKIIKNKNNK